MELETTEEKIWIELANLFFLDTEPDEIAFKNVAHILKTNSWNKEKTELTLIQLIAPHAGANLGYLLWPVIGAWDEFNTTLLCDKIRKTRNLRTKHPNWYFLLSDWWCRRMLRQLDIDQLLRQL
ncbi:MAG: hypothetical protein JNL11_04965 [Bdellovibrionaceae bacterium]|nr:hypothetical protein [Pseudobdellovibrionaceae bacterium]